MSSELFRAVTAACPTAYDGAIGGCLPAGLTAVMPMPRAAGLAKALQAAGKPAARVSQVGHYTRPYCGQNLAGKSLLGWRGCGIGDQLVFAGCLAWLKERYPVAIVDLLCDPLVAQALWAGAENLPFRVVAEPVPLPVWQAYSYHWLAAGLCDGDLEPGQPDIWAGHLRAIGQDEAPAEARRPLVPQSAAWDKRASKFALSALAVPGKLPVCSRPRKLLLWQLAASSSIRSLPPEQTVATLELLAARRPDLRVVLTGSRDQLEAYWGAARVANVVADTSPLRLQEVFALVGRVDALVCPDSCLGHVAGACGTPTVSLWGPFPARARAATYPNHHAISGAVPCAPCWQHEVDAFGTVRQGCPQAASGDAAARKWCKGLMAIRPEEIAAKIEEIV